MKLDKLNVILVLLCLVIFGLLIQNRKLNQRLENIENKVEEAINYSESASNYAQEASNHAEEAYQNSFGNMCSVCP